MKVIIMAGGRGTRVASVNDAIPKPMLPICGKPVYDTYQRIVGYLVPSRAYSKERFREFNTRQWYSYAEAMSE